MPIGRRELFAAGWPGGRGLRAVLARARELEASGLTGREELLAELRRSHPPGGRRESPGAGEANEGSKGEPAPLAEAIGVGGPEEEANLERARRALEPFLRSPAVERAALMPDACPSGGGPGAGAPVGSVIAARGAIFPAGHGSDICCSLEATFFRSERTPGELLDAVVGATRFGPGGRRPDDGVADPVTDEPVWANPFLSGLEKWARIHIADQGDGNHFAFLGRVRPGEVRLDRLRAAGHEEAAAALGDGIGGDFYVLVTHHGSRGLGAKVYQRGMKAALKQARARLGAARAAKEPDAAAYLDADSEAGRSYGEALGYIARWTLANHRSIHRRALAAAGARPDWAMGNGHNFVWRRGDLFLHGKGATPAWKDAEGRPRLGLIPLNLASPILLVLGADNGDYLSFCPHGAGRDRSRAATLRPYRDKEGEVDAERVADAVAAATAGFDVRWFCGRPDLTETPIGYKPPGWVREQIGRFGLAEVVAEIAPLGCVMAGDTGRRPRRDDILSPKQLRQIEHRADRRRDRQALRGAAGADGLD